MPNHVTNIITASPEVIRAITREHTPEEHAAKAQDEADTRRRYKERTGNDWPYPEDKLPERFLDFNTFAPMPEQVQSTTVGTGGFNHASQDGWYGWSIANWGTKWNAYSQSIEPVPGDLCQLRFDTAWSHPAPIMEAVAAKLAEDFPDEVAYVAYADEDFGSNVGRYRIDCGQIVDFEELTGTDEGKELAAQVKYGQSYAELKAEWDADEIESARNHVFRKRLAKERGLAEVGYNIIREEGLEVPEDIAAAIATVEQAEDVFREDSAIVKALV